MDLILFPCIYYEVITESCEGQTFSEFFTLANIIVSREAALNCFLESTLTDEGRPDEIFVTVYMRYLRTGERIELVSTGTYEQKGQNLKALEKELFFYQSENIVTNVALYNHKMPNSIVILWPRCKNTHQLVNPTTSVMIASQYWIFLDKKKERYMIA